MSFTVTPDPGYSVTYESLSLYHGSYNSNGSFKITYAIGAGSDVEALGATAHTAANADPLTLASSDFADFTTDQVVTWKILIFESGDPNYGNRFDDITINGTVIPEPGTICLLAMGLGGLVARRKRR